MAIGSFVSVFGKEKIHSLFIKLRGKNTGLLGVIPASLLGIVSPLCMYGTIPIVASFAAHGTKKNSIVKESELAAFMVGSILLNPQLFFYTAVLGMPVLVIRFVICFLGGIAAGLLVRVLFKDKPFFNFSAFSSCNRVVGKRGGVRKVENLLGHLPYFDTGWSLREKIFEFIKNFGRNVRVTGVFFLIGILLSALFQAYVPPDGFARLFGAGNMGFGILMAATIGVPLYMCGGGTIPLLQAWLHHGMSMGSASAFMITGPGTKITNLGALKIVLGFKHFLFYILFIVFFALFCGFVIDLIFYSPLRIIDRL